MGISGHIDDKRTAALQGKVARESAAASADNWFGGVGCDERRRNSALRASRDHHDRQEKYRWSAFSSS